MVTAVSPVDKLKPLALPAKKNGMVSYNISGAQRLDADLFFPALADKSLALIHAHLGQISAIGFCKDLCKLNRGAARRVFFVAMMRFQHFHVKTVS